MGKLVNGRSKYTDEQRRQAVIEYEIKGNDKAVADATGISRQTINTWRLHSDWWDELLGTVRHEIDDLILGQNLQIAKKSNENVLDCLENGDEKLIWDKTKNKHVIKRVKPGAKDSMVTGGIAQDKARRQMNLPTQIHAQTADVQIKSFIDEFRELSQSFKERRVVSTQENSEVVE